MQWREENGSRWLEAELPGARVAFTTRLGGVSAGPFESLNLGMKTDDELDRVRENRQRVSAALGIEPERVLMGHQVHGAEIAWHDEPQRPSPFAETLPADQEVDAQLTAIPGLAVLVQVADCLPIALAGEGGVAMVHGGWRGLAAGIVGRAAEAVGATAVAIGPGIGPCCYEVGDEVLAALGVVPRKRSGGVGHTLDLTAVAQAQLKEAGVAQIESSGLCTSCNPELFFSHRRDNGTTGRQAGLAWLEP